MKRLLKQITIIALIIVGLSCSKQKDYQVNFSSEIEPVSESPDMIVKATISSDETLEARGIIFSIDTAVLIDSYYYSYSYNAGIIESGKIIDETNATNKNYNLIGLRPATVYYYRLFSIYNGLIKYGALQSFTTNCGGLGCGPAGGQIIYMDGNGGGIEVASNFTTQRNIWGCSNTFINGTSDEVGTGQANTNEIINECGGNTLAQLCANYEQNGFSDYYMPSIDELELIYNKVFIAENNPYLWLDGVYYSSTESGSTSCMAMQFYNGSSVTFSKGVDNYGAIPVRSF